MNRCILTFHSDCMYIEQSPYATSVASIDVQLIRVDEFIVSPDAYNAAFALNTREEICHEHDR